MKPQNSSVSPFGPFHWPKWQNSLPFHTPEAWKSYLFRAEPPRIGHYREYPPRTSKHYKWSITSSWMERWVINIWSITIALCHLFSVWFFRSNKQMTKIGNKSIPLFHLCKSAHFIVCVYCSRCGTGQSNVILLTSAGVLQLSITWKESKNSLFQFQ